PRRRCVRRRGGPLRGGSRRFRDLRSRLSVPWTRGVVRRDCSWPPRAPALDRKLQLLRAARRARGARDAATVKGAVGFGVFSTEGGPQSVGFRVGGGVRDLASSGRL